MKETAGTTGLVMNEPLLWEKGGKGRCGFSMPRRDIEPSPIDEGLVGPVPDFPELSEVDVVRHYTRLSQWNYGVDTGMYPLGSCTMKYNPKVNEKYASLPGFTGVHPLLPPSMVQGALKLMYDLERFLSEITGMDATTLQPAAGAQGELTGTMLIYAFLRSRGEHRSKFLIPDTAHGTNPASVSLCDFRPIPVESNEDGILSPEAVAKVMDEDVAGILVTNPNTLGLFEENIREISEIVHGKGGLVYCDGANMNAVMGIVEMGKIGVDVMHLNLHKTFSTPHGGGGPGSGPVCVKNHLEPFLPVPRVVQEDGTYCFSSDYPQSIGKVHGFYGNFGVMIKAYSYILSMGPEDLKKASQLAVLNANYIKESLKTVFTLPYDRPCMHECVFSDKRQNVYKITTLDMAKRLIDCGFHPPTIYFPLVVAGAIMVEPTETESKETLDQFIETCKAIAKEAEEAPDVLHEAPKNAKVRRLDEVTAARQPCLID
ncbi:MAG: aminotransferase class V-fold PLP-dependent enzyme [Proteobacteria bacterium]|nr:aminotransferase class V-fold PLP-dependent enzyme [Pseudomonadota bacterium]